MKATRKVCDFHDERALPFDFPGDRHGVLLIHGFTGSCAHMRLLGEHLQDKGFTVKGVNLPGHATTVEDMGRYNWKSWLEAVRDAAGDMRQHCDMVSAAGLSMGGVLTLLLAEQNAIDAAVTISAPMAVQNRLMPLARVGSLLVKTVDWKPDVERDKKVDPRYDYGYPSFPTKSAADLAKLISMARRNLYAVTCPILAIQSHADDTISKDSAEVIVDGVKSEQKGILWLEDVPHVCTISKEHETIAKAMAEHLRKAEQARA